ncbi:MAG: hypothetical protein KGL39_45130 [Patescibacteria group bacterium]|nr:hypothetical protein [Patescibacteria group bacterium]
MIFAIATVMIGSWSSSSLGSLPEPLALDNVKVETTSHSIDVIPPTRPYEPEGPPAFLMPPPSITPSPQPVQGPSDADNRPLGWHQVIQADGAISLKYGTVVQGWFYDAPATSFGDSSCATGNCQSPSAFARIRRGIFGRR